MDTAREDEHDDEPESGEQGGVILSPEVEARLVERMRQMEESDRAGLLIPWEKVRAERGI